MDSEEIVEMEVTIVTKTDKAVLVHRGDKGLQAWLPLSKIELDGNRLRAPKWLARRVAKIGENGDG